MISSQSSQGFLKELDKKLWAAADRLRANLDAAVYKHAVLGLIFLKYVSDSFAMRQREVEAQLRDPKSDYFLDLADFKFGGSAKYDEAIRQELEERDYYLEKNVFWVPALARWKTLQDSAKLPPGTEIEITNGKKTTYKISSTGKLIDDALDAVEKENPNRAERDRPPKAPRRVRAAARINRKGVLNKTYTQLQLDPANLSSLIDLIATIPFEHADLHAKDILCHVYEPSGARQTAKGSPPGERGSVHQYFLGQPSGARRTERRNARRVPRRRHQFALAEGKALLVRSAERSTARRASAEALVNISRRSPSSPSSSR